MIFQIILEKIKKNSIKWSSHLLLDSTDDTRFTIKHLGIYHPNPT